VWIVIKWDLGKVKFLSIVAVSILHIIIIISFMQDIYTHIPQTNHVSKEYSVAAMLHIILFPVLNLLHFRISTF
jgi:hypothetical protein